MAISIYPRWVSSIFNRILQLQLPFPSVLSIVVSNIPVVVLLLAISAYLKDYFVSVTVGRFQPDGIYDFIVGMFVSLLFKYVYVINET